MKRIQAESIAQGETFIAPPMNPLCDAAEHGDLMSLTKLVSTGSDVNTTGENGNSALAFACANGHADCTAFLVSRGADVAQVSVHGSSPLHAACWADSARCVHILLEAKADINLPTTVGLTPLHVAVQSDRDEIVGPPWSRLGMSRTRPPPVHDPSRRLRSWSSAASTGRRRRATRRRRSRSR